MTDQQYPVPFAEALRVIRPAWHSYAACRGKDELMWDETRAEEAKQICSGCPVEGHCLEYALNRGEVGVWGGTDDDERRKIMRKISVPKSPLLGAEAV